MAFAQAAPVSFWEPDLNSPRAEDPFPRANWNFFGGVQGLTTYTPRRESLGFFTLGAGYFLFDNLSVNGEFGIAPGTLFRCDNQIARGFEGQFLARWHALHTRRLSVILEGGVGALHAEDFLGAQSRSDDLLLSAGVGAAWRISYNFHILADARYAHITGGSVLSNQGTRSAEAVQYGVSLLIVK